MELYFKNREEWHNWLKENGASADGIWMKIYKKRTKKESVPYIEAVEEALCFGWIDGKIKRINDDYYIQHYTPRRRNSRWSRYNIERVEKLIREGRMTPAGIKAYNEIFKKPELAYDNRASGEPEIPEDLLSALKENETALSNFMKFSRSTRRIYIGWLNSSKRAETRSGRIPKIVEFARQNRKPGMM
jgi:uncharacterized protein YdeI (YjbR/CyaY-like superfamily)